MAPTAALKAERERDSARTNLSWLESRLNDHANNPISEDEVENCWTMLITSHQKIMDAHEALNVAAPADIEEHNKLHLDLLNLSSKLYTGLGKIKRTFLTTVTNVSTTSDIPLPKLELPTFAGDYRQWTSFHDLFKTTIHDNQKLSGAQKLQYLKSSLRDDAAKLVQSFQVTDSNYEEAWKVLNKRYQNTREIVHSHLHRLFTQSSLTNESSRKLRELIDTTSECIRSLEMLGQPVQTWDSILVYLVTSKLDGETRKQWEMSLTTDDLTTWKQLYKYLDQRARALAASSLSKGHHGSSNFSKQDSAHVHFSSNQFSKCIICNENHAIYRCSKFLQLSPTERLALAKEKQLCFNCLRTGHSVVDCNRSSCRECSKKHNTLLHGAENDESTQNVRSPKIPVRSHVTCGDIKLPQVLLATLKVDVLDKYGQRQTVRAILDNCSDTSFISEHCVQRLGLQKRKVNIPVSGIGGTEITPVKSVVEVAAFSRTNKDVGIDFQALVVTNVTGILPSRKIDVSNFKHIETLELADPTFYEPGTIDMLLGADIYDDILLDSKVRGVKGQPTAYETIFGYVLLGKIDDSLATTVKVHLAHCDSIGPSLQLQWNKFIDKN